MKVSLALLSLLASTISVAAITDGDLDGDDHPNVGLMIAKDAAGNPMWRCSGTLLSPTIFVSSPNTGSQVEYEAI
jgi:hypothetical protein